MDFTIQKSKFCSLIDFCYIYFDLIYFCWTLKRQFKIKSFKWHLPNLLEWDPFLVKTVKSKKLILLTDSLNTSYLTESSIVFTLKMESVSKNTIFGLKMLFLKFLYAGDYFPLLHKSDQNHKFSNKNNYLPAWRDFKINFSRPLFIIIFRPKIVFLDTHSILRVKTMYEQVK